jgi:hypothetical protein
VGVSILSIPHIQSPLTPCHLCHHQALPSRCPTAPPSPVQTPPQTFQTSEGLGLYGPDPLHRHTWVATGDCDQGPLGATLGGVIIASEILGWEGTKMYKDIYSPK